MIKCYALILAAGSGLRFGTDIPKQFQKLGGQPLLRYSVTTFMAHSRVHSVRVVIRAVDEKRYKSEFNDLALLPPVMGGNTRQSSVLRGLQSLSEDPPDIVLIHDGARPFVTKNLIDSVIRPLDSCDGAIPAIPVNETIHRFDTNGALKKTMSRNALFSAQTPQAFWYKKILKAHQEASNMHMTDDAMVASESGLKILQVQGDQDNFKFTESGDLERGKKVLGINNSHVRTGIGFDVHAFGEGKHLILGGVEIAHSQKLIGHSDADALLHAITDALLGAIACGDIGSHFPPSDPKWSNADSSIFLKFASALIAERKGQITNLDATIICEEPKISPYRKRIQANISNMLEIPEDSIGIKATTTECLGFSGRKEGLAVQAIATVMFSPEKNLMS